MGLVWAMKLHSNTVLVQEKSLNGPDAVHLCECLGEYPGERPTSSTFKNKSIWFLWVSLT